MFFILRQEEFYQLLKMKYVDLFNKKSCNKNGLLAWWRQGWKSFCNSRNTLKVADALRGGIIKCYYLDVRRLKRQLTFKGVEEKLQILKKNFTIIFLYPDGQTNITQKEILETLLQARVTLIEQHNGLSSLARKPDQ